MINAFGLVAILCGGQHSDIFTICSLQVENVRLIFLNCMIILSCPLAQKSVHFPLVWWWVQGSLVTPLLKVPNISDLQMSIHAAEGFFFKSFFLCCFFSFPSSPILLAKPLRFHSIWPVVASHSSLWLQKHTSV